MQYIGKAGVPPNEVWIEDDGILYLKMRGVHDAKRDVDIHKVLVQATEIIRPTGKKVRLLIDMREMKGVTIAGRRSSYKLLNELGAECVAFAAPDQVTGALIKMIAGARVMRGDYRCFDTVEQARNWLSGCCGKKKLS